MKAFAGAFAEGLQRGVVEGNRSLEFGAGRSVFDADDAFGKAKAFALGGFRVKEALEAASDVGGAGEVGFSFRVSGEKGKYTR